MPVWLISAAVCSVGLVPMAGLGAAMPAEVNSFLVMGLGGLFAAVAAHRISNVLAPDRGRLLPIVGATQAAAAVVAGGFLALLYYQGAIRGFMAPLINPLLVSAGVISLCATAASALLRTTESDPERDSRIRVMLLSGGCLTVFVVVLITFLVLEILNVPP